MWRTPACCACSSAQKNYPYWLKLHDAAQGHTLASAQAEIMYDLGHAEFALKMWPDAVVAFDAFLQAYPTAPAAQGAAYERMLAAVQADPVADRLRGGERT